MHAFFLRFESSVGLYFAGRPTAYRDMCFLWSQSSNFLQSLNQLRKKLEVGETLKKKVLEAGMRENESMRKRREDFEVSLAAFERRCAHIQVGACSLRRVTPWI